MTRIDDLTKRLELLRVEIEQKLCEIQSLNNQIDGMRAYRERLIKAEMVMTDELVSVYRAKLTAR